MISRAVVVLGVVAASSALLPPGYEDYLYCNKGFSLRKKNSGMLGGMSNFYECVDAAGKTGVLKTWGPKLKDADKVRAELVKNGFHLGCVGQATSCQKAKQEAEESNLLGTSVPECDGPCHFREEQCNPSIYDDCWCVDTLTGNKMTGAAQTACLPKKAKEPVVEGTNQATGCTQTRNAMLAKQEKINVPECNADGTWKAKQCSMFLVMGAPSCWCVDSKTGVQLTGANKDACMTTPPAKEPVEPSTPTCASAQKKAMTETNGEFPMCQEGGKLWEPKQCLKDCWCVDQVTGAKLPPTSMISCGLLDGKPVLTKCQKWRSVVLKEGLLGAFVPQCTKDGQFEKKQCHASTNTCFDVDQVTGVKMSGATQDSKPVEKSSHAASNGDDKGSSHTGLITIIAGSAALVAAVAIAAVFMSRRTASTKRELELTGDDIEYLKGEEAATEEVEHAL